MPLIATAIRNAKPGETARRLFDAFGLYLEISPAGGRWWRFKYRFEGKEKCVSSHFSTWGSTANSGGATSLRSKSATSATAVKLPLEPS